jgi:hypothetical protein
MEGQSTGLREVKTSAVCFKLGVKIVCTCKETVLIYAR